MSVALNDLQMAIILFNATVCRPMNHCVIMAG